MITLRKCASESLTEQLGVHNVAEGRCFKQYNKIRSQRIPKTNTFSKQSTSADNNITG